jgi:hypothetical protein
MDWALAECLEHGKSSALQAFVPMVQTLELKPETIAGLRLSPALSPKVERPYPELAWSTEPGCYERHLQRRHQNPLFPPASRVVTQEEVDAARTHDAAEAKAFHAEVWELVRASQKLSDPLTVRQAFEIRQKIDDLMDRAAELGGNLAKEEEMLSTLYEALISDVRRGLEQVENDEALQRLQKAEEFRTKFVEQVHNRFFAQMKREDSPIKPEEIVPSLLTEEPESIQLVMNILDDDTKNLFQREAIGIIKEAEAAGATVHQANKKLQAMGVQRGL